MNKPLVSITSAFYNESPLLLDMIKSVFVQTFTDWELILLDDGSTDNSYEVAQSINDPRVRVFSNERNLGTAVSLNRMTTLARGKYIARMDSDDMSSITRIEKQVQLMESQYKVDVVGTGMCYLDRNDKPLGHRYVQPLHAQICGQPSRTFGLCHGSILGKKSWFEKNRYDESLQLGLAEDFNLLLKSHRHSKFGNVPEPLYYCRVPSYSLKKMLIIRRNSAKFIFEYYYKEGNFSEALYYVAMQFAKFAATVLIFSTGLRKKLMARRFERLSDADMAFYNQEICKIKSTKLPLQPLGQGVYDQQNI